MRRFLLATGCALSIIGLVIAIGLHVQNVSRTVPKRPPQPTPAPGRANETHPPPQAISYSIVRLTGRKHALDQYTLPQLRLLEKLNRADLRHLRRLKSLVVPSRWDADELAYSPLPAQYQSAEQNPKCIVVDLPAQVFGAYEHGELVHWGPVNSGRAQTPTPEGAFQVTWKAKLHYSTVDPDWKLRWVLNFGIHRGIDLHAYALSGRPASHGCIRLLASDARWLYQWAEQWKLDRRGRPEQAGTPVAVLGAYNYAATPPWRSSGWLAQRIVLPELPGTTADAGPPATGKS